MKYEKLLVEVRKLTSEDRNKLFEEAKQVDEARKQYEDAVAKLKGLGVSMKKATTSTTRKPKYANPNNPNETWTGSGQFPKDSWLRKAFPGKAWAKDLDAKQKKTLDSWLIKSDEAESEGVAVEEKAA